MNRYIPECYTLFYSNGKGFDLYINDAKVIGFKPRAFKPFICGKAKDNKAAIDYLNLCIESQKEAERIKAEKQAKRKAWSHGLKVGDIFVSSWGYEQTNVNFYQVTEIKGKVIIACQIKQEKEETGYLSGNTKPIKDAFYPDEYKRKFIPQMNYNSKPYIRINSFANAYLVEDLNKSYYWSAYY